MASKIGIKNVINNDGEIAIVTDQEMIYSSGGLTVGGRCWWRYVLQTLLHQMHLDICDSDIAFNGGTITITKRNRAKGLPGARPTVPISIDPEDFIRKITRFNGIAYIGDSGDVGCFDEVLSATA